MFITRMMACSAASGTVARRVHWLILRCPAAPSLAIASSDGTTFVSRLKMMLELM